MKIQLASDLHLELIEAFLPDEKLVKPAPDADQLVLAGDIHKPEGVIDLFGDWPVPVLYVAGNHEFHGPDWVATRQFLTAATQGTSVTFLDNDVLHMGAVGFSVARSGPTSSKGVTRNRRSWSRPGRA